VNSKPTQQEAVTCKFTELTQRLLDAGMVPGTPLSSVAISPTNPGLVLITASGFTGKHAFLCNFKKKSPNKCSDITRNLPDIPALSGIFDQCSPNTSLLVGTDIGVFHFHTGGGGSWTNSGKGSLPNTPVYMLRQRGSSVVAATHGRGVWLAKGCPVP
jgi:hypothetical protein